MLCKTSFIILSLIKKGFHSCESYVCYQGLANKRDVEELTIIFENMFKCIRSYKCKLKYVFVAMYAGFSRYNKEIHEV